MYMKTKSRVNGISATSRLSGDMYENKGLTSPPAWEAEIYLKTQNLEYLRFLKS